MVAVAVKEYEDGQTLKNLNNVLLFLENNLTHGGQIMAGKPGKTRLLMIQFHKGMSPNPGNIFFENLFDCWKSSQKSLVQIT